MQNASNETDPAPRSLIAPFQDLPDPRVERTRDHDLIDILVIAICTQLCGGESFDDMEAFGLAKQEWFKTFLSLRNGIPSHDTFNRVFAALEPRAFLEFVLRWTQSLRQAVAQEIVALGGTPRPSSSTRPSSCWAITARRPSAPWAPRRHHPAPRRWSWAGPRPTTRRRCGRS